MSCFLPINISTGLSTAFLTAYFSFYDIIYAPEYQCNRITKHKSCQKHCLCGIYSEIIQQIIAIVQHKTVRKIYIIALPVYNRQNRFIHNSAEFYTQHKHKHYCKNAVSNVYIFHNGDNSYGIVYI